jgi:hypothetical protein
MQAEAVLVSEQDRQVTSLMLCVQALAQLQGEIQRLPSTLDALKQLEFFLRRDDPTKRTAHKHLAKWKTMQTYLLPLLVKYHKDEKLVFLILKLLVRLTLPIPQDVEFPLDELWNLQVYKSCFVLHQFAVPVIMMYLCKPLDSLDLYFFFFIVYLFIFFIFFLVEMIPSCLTGLNLSLVYLKICLEFPVLSLLIVRHIPNFNICTTSFFLCCIRITFSMRSLLRLC